MPTMTAAEEKLDQVSRSVDQVVEVFHFMEGEDSPRRVLCPRGALFLLAVAQATAACFVRREWLVSRVRPWLLLELLTRYSHVTEAGGRRSSDGRQEVLLRGACRAGRRPPGTEHPPRSQRAPRGSWSSSRSLASVVLAVLHRRAVHEDARLERSSCMCGVYSCRITGNWKKSSCNYSNYSCNYNTAVITATETPAAEPSPIRGE